MMRRTLFVRRTLAIGCMTGVAVVPAALLTSGSVASANQLNTALVSESFGSASAAGFVDSVKTETLFILLRAHQCAG